jgi:hypothetical protein
MKEFPDACYRNGEVSCLLKKLFRRILSRGALAKPGPHRDGVRVA